MDVRFTRGVKVSSAVQILPYIYPRVTIPLPFSPVINCPYFSETVFAGCSQLCDLYVLLKF